MPSVFVSHRGADAQAAEKLATEIRAAGHDVWLDEWQLNVGDSIIEKMNAGLQSAEYVVLCYSDQGVLAPWISREWMSALARQLESAGVRLLPVRLSGGNAPAILSDIKYADLVADWSRGVKDLLKAIR
jgi:hypothetical protein